MRRRRGAPTVVDPLPRSPEILEPLAAKFFDGFCAPATTTARFEGRHRVQLASLLALRNRLSVPLDAYQIDFGKVGTASTRRRGSHAALTKAMRSLRGPGRLPFKHPGERP